MALTTRCLSYGSRIALAALKDAEWLNMACRYKITNLHITAMFDKFILLIGIIHVK